MPWQEIDPGTALAVQKSTGTQYLLFFASGTPPWCSDCRDVQSALEDAFSSSEAELQVVRVGNREEWKRPAENRWRGEPFRVSGIPTLIKIVDGKEVKRVDETGCTPEGLKKFIDESSKL